MKQSLLGSFLVLLLITAAGCVGGPQPAPPTHPQTDSGGKSLPDTPRTANGSFVPCTEPVPADGCVAWRLHEPIQPGSLTVVLHPAVPHTVLARERSVQIIPLDLWPAGEVRFSGEGLALSGERVALPDGRVVVAGREDGSDYVRDALRRLQAEPEIQARTSSGVAHSTALLWTDAIWLDAPELKPANTMEANHFRSLTRGYAAVREQKGPEPPTDVVAIGSQMWIREPGSERFQRSNWLPELISDPLLWEEVERVGEARTAAVIGREMLAGRDALVLALRWAEPVPERYGSARVWLDAQTGLPLRIWTVQAIGVDAGGGEFTSWGRLTDFQYETVPDLPSAIQGLLETQGR